MRPGEEPGTHDSRDHGRGGGAHHQTGKERPKCNLRSGVKGRQASLNRLTSQFLDRFSVPAACYRLAFVPGTNLVKTHFQDFP